MDEGLEYAWKDKEPVCPNCEVKMVHREGYWECENCFHAATDEELIFGMEDDYEEYWNGDRMEDIPDVCKECGGPWPYCTTSCDLFDD